MPLLLRNLTSLFEGNGDTIDFRTETKDSLKTLKCVGKRDNSLEESTYYPAASQDWLSCKAGKV